MKALQFHFLMLLVIMAAVWQGRGVDNHKEGEQVRRISFRIESKCPISFLFS